MVRDAVRCHYGKGDAGPMPKIIRLHFVRDKVGSFFDTVRDLVGSVEGPADWAAEHDHYIHGTPKRVE